MWSYVTKQGWSSFCTQSCPRIMGQSGKVRLCSQHLGNQGLTATYLPCCLLSPSLELKNSLFLLSLLFSPPSIKILNSQWAKAADSRESYSRPNSNKTHLAYSSSGKVIKLRNRAAILVCNFSVKYK